MDSVLIVPPENIGKNFIPEEYLPKGQDEYYQRNNQSVPPNQDGGTCAQMRLNDWLKMITPLTTGMKYWLLISLIQSD